MRKQIILDATKVRVAAATVKLTKLKGQGVLVRGGLILTAAHCIEWSGEGEMALGGRPPEPIETAEGQTFGTSVYAVEPVTDIAVLGQIDGQSGPAKEQSGHMDDQRAANVGAQEADAFDKFAANVPGLRRFTDLPLLRKSMPVWIRTRTAGWIAGKVQHGGLTGTPDSARVMLNTTMRIEAGTSGGLVVDRRGQSGCVLSSSGAASQFGRRKACPHCKHDPFDMESV